MVAVTVIAAAVAVALAVVQAWRSRVWRGLVPSVWVMVSGAVVAIGQPVAAAGVKIVAASEAVPAARPVSRVVSV